MDERVNGEYLVKVRYRKIKGASRVKGGEVKERKGGIFVVPVRMSHGSLSL